MRSTFGLEVRGSTNVNNTFIDDQSTLNVTKAVGKFQETEFRGLVLKTEQLDLLGSKKAVNTLTKQTTSIGGPRRSVMPTSSDLLHQDLKLTR